MDNSKVIPSRVLFIKYNDYYLSADVKSGTAQLVEWMPQLVEKDFGAGGNADGYLTTTDAR